MLVQFRYLKKTKQPIIIIIIIIYLLFIFNVYFKFYLTLKFLFE